MIVYRNFIGHLLDPPPDTSNVWHPSNDLLNDAMKNLEGVPTPTDRQVYDHFAQCSECAYQGLAIRNLEPVL